jgi:hypothetical protein
VSTSRGIVRRVTSRGGGSTYAVAPKLGADAAASVATEAPDEAPPAATLPPSTGRSNTAERTAAPPAQTPPPAPKERADEYAYLDEEPASLDGEDSGRRVADAYSSDQGRRGGGYNLGTKLRARSRSPRNLMPRERPAVATLRYLINSQEAHQKQNGRYASLSELAGSLRLDVKPSGDGFVRAGYRFTLIAKDDGFSATAMPLEPGPRAFIGDDSGFIREGLE